MAPEWLSVCLSYYFVNVQVRCWIGCWSELFGRRCCDLSCVRKRQLSTNVLSSNWECCALWRDIICQEDAFARMVNCAKLHCSGSSALGYVKVIRLKFMGRFEQSQDRCVVSQWVERSEAAHCMLSDPITSFLYIFLDITVIAKCFTFSILDSLWIYLCKIFPMKYVYRPLFWLFERTLQYSLHKTSKACDLTLSDSL